MTQSRSDSYFIRRFKAYLCVLLCLLLVSPQFSSNERSGVVENREKYQAPYQWALKSYLEGRYREALRRLNLLASFIENEPGDWDLKINACLLTGAAYEKLGRIVEARRYYKLARENGKNRVLVLEGVNTEELVEFQRVVLDNTAPLMERVVQVEAQRPEQKRASRFLTVLSLVAVLGLALYAALSRPGDVVRHSREFPADPDYDAKKLGIEWVTVPAGPFLMGSEDPDAQGDEKPVHPVNLDEFKISKYEITFGQFLEFCREEDYPPPLQYGTDVYKNAAINVSYNMARNFCRWLSRRTGKRVNLPTEAQWEKAARGVDGRRYPWGDASPDCTFVNHCCHGPAIYLKSYPANVSPYGVLDMAGNVSEWCRDVYGETYYSESPSVNPTGPAEETFFHVIRGGNWSCTGSARASDRDFRNTSSTFRWDATTFPEVGFRIVWEN